MILEELVGSFVSLVSSLIIQTPPISRENLQKDYAILHEENLEQSEAFDELIHREYEQDEPTGLPNDEENISILLHVDQQPRRSFYESFLRSCKANIGLITAVVFILGFLIVGAGFVDLSTTNACIEWMHNNLKVPSRVQVLQMVGMSVSVFPVMSWFPVCIAMLWGFKEFKKHYLWFLCVILLVTGSITCVYKIVMFDKLAMTNDNVYMLV
jgi:hypothetical protein